MKIKKNKKEKEGFLIEGQRKVKMEKSGGKQNNLLKNSKNQQ